MHAQHRSLYAHCRAHASRVNQHSGSQFQGPSLLSFLGGGLGGVSFLSTQNLTATALKWVYGRQFRGSSLTDRIIRTAKRPQAECCNIPVPIQPFIQPFGNGLQYGSNGDGATKPAQSLKLRRKPSPPYLRQVTKKAMVAPTFTSLYGGAAREVLSLQCGKHIVSGTHHLSGGAHLP